MYWSSSVNKKTKNHHYKFNLLPMFLQGQVQFSLYWLKFSYLTHLIFWKICLKSAGLHIMSLLALAGFVWRHFTIKNVSTLMVCLGKKQLGSTSHELFQDWSLIWNIYVPIWPIYPYSFICLLSANKKCSFRSFQISSHGKIQINLWSYGTQTIHFFKTCKKPVSMKMFSDWFEISSDCQFQKICRIISVCWETMHEVVSAK